MHCVHREHCGGVLDFTCHALSVVCPLWLEGEPALCINIANGGDGGGDGGSLGVFQVPLQVDVISKAGEIQDTGQSDTLEFPDFWWPQNVRLEWFLWGEKRERPAC